MPTTTTETLADLVYQIHAGDREEALLVGRALLAALRQGDVLPNVDAALELVEKWRDEEDADLDEDDPSY